MGLFASEVSRFDIERARVILIGLHWFFPLGVLDGMLAAIRAINPAAAVVVGGLTASFFKRELLGRFDADYLVTGDVEHGFPALVAHLLAGEEPPPLPNVTSRRGAGPSGRRLRRVEFDALDWIGIDWFRSYRRWVEDRHAGYHPGELMDGVHPVLPLTRGCVRECDFCFGAYQRDVFGPRVLARSPARLAADLRRIAADGALRFVTLMFADACYVAQYAPALRDLQLPLDAFLMYCGTVEQPALEAVRSGFAGRAFVLNIPPGELAPLRRDPPEAEQRAAFEAMMAHWARLPGTSAHVFHVKRGPLPSAQQAAAAGAPLTVVSGEDWSIRRPDRNALVRGATPDPMAEQLSELVEIGREVAALHLLRLLVPAAGRAINPELDTATLLSEDYSRDFDAVEGALHRALLQRIRRDRVVGFHGVTLSWSVAPAVAGWGPLWASPGAQGDGECAWDTGLGGLCWRGQLRVGGALPLWVSPLPRVLDAGGAPVPIASWARARVAALRVMPGPPRVVALGGEERAQRLVLWSRDGDREQRVELPLPRAPAPRLAQGRWPSPQWPRAALGAFALPSVPSLLGAVAEQVAFDDQQVEITLPRVAPAPVTIVLCPRRDDHRMRAAGGFSYEILGAPSENERARLRIAVEALLRRAQRGLPARPAPPAGS